MSIHSQVPELAGSTARYHKKPPLGRPPAACCTIPMDSAAPFPNAATTPFCPKMGEDTATSLPCDAEIRAAPPTSWIMENANR
jgi:hypothetical protein